MMMMRMTNRMIGVALLAAACMAYEAGDQINVIGGILKGTYSYVKGLGGTAAFYRNDGRGPSRQHSSVMLRFNRTDTTWDFMNLRVTQDHGHTQSSTLLTSKPGQTKDEIPLERKSWVAYNDNFEKVRRRREHVGKTDALGRSVGSNYGSSVKLSEDFAIQHISRQARSRKSVSGGPTTPRGKPAPRRRARPETQEELLRRFKAELKDVELEETPIARRLREKMELRLQKKPEEKSPTSSNASVMSLASQLTSLSANSTNTETSFGWKDPKTGERLEDCNDYLRD